MTLARAVFAIAVLTFTTNTFAAGRELASRPLIPQREFVWNLAVASAGGRFLTVWEQRLPHSSAIYGVLSDADGRRISPAAFLLLETTHTASIELVGTSDSFAMFWTDYYANTVRQAHIDLDGRVLDTRASELPSGIRVDVAWNGERFLAVVFRPGFHNRAVAAFLERDGTLIRNDLILGAASDSTAFEIAILEDGFLVFTGSRSTFFAYVITNDGAVTQSIAGDPATYIASTALSDDRLLVVWSAPGGQLRSAIWQNGTKLRDQILMVNHKGIAPVAVLSGDGHHLLAFIDNIDTHNTISTMHLDDDGARTSEPVAVSETGALPPPGASNGNVVFVPHQPYPVHAIDSVSFRRDATVATREKLSVRPASQSAVVVGTGGGSMLSVFNESTTDGGTRVRAAVVGRDFAPESVHELAADGLLRARSLAWSGTEYLVVYQERARGMRALRVTYNGVPIGEPANLGDAPPDISTAAVTWAGDRWAVAWVDHRDSVIRYVTVSRGGVAAPPRDLRPSEKILIEVALAYDGSRVRLAWIESDYPLFPTIPLGDAVFTTLLRRDGRMEGDVPLSIPASNPSRVTLASNGKRVVLLVDELTHTSINVIDAETRQLLSARTLFEWPAHSDVTWDGDVFVAALSYRGARTYAAIFRLDEDGTEIEAPRGIMTIGTTMVTVAASPGYDAVIGVTESDAAAGVRAVIYAERELPRLPDPPPPPVNVRLHTISAYELRLTWDPPPGVDVEIYDVQARRNDGRIEVVYDAGPGFARTYDSNAMRIRTFVNGMPSPWSDWITAQPLPRRRTTRP